MSTSVVHVKGTYQHHMLGIRFLLDAKTHDDTKKNYFQFNIKTEV